MLIRGESYEKAYKEYGLIIIGQIIKVEVQSSKWVYTVVVKEWFKGKKTGNVIIIKTSPPGGECGVFATRGNWLLFFGNSFQGNFHTSICTPTRRYNPKDKELEFFRRKAKFHYR